MNDHFFWFRPLPLGAFGQALWAGLPSTGSTPSDMSSATEGSAEGRGDGTDGEGIFVPRIGHLYGIEAPRSNTSEVHIY
jgi:hypothetical protein